ncbi:MAG: hypothetical protein GXP27_15180 [Planctomycetes bacterium]|nr:hypothetical protein [Planctomycetota bacterium]
MLIVLCVAAVVASAAAMLVMYAGWRDGLYDEQTAKNAAVTARMILENVANERLRSCGFPEGSAVRWSLTTVQTAIPKVLANSVFVSADSFRDRERAYWVLRHPESGAQLVMSAAGDDQSSLIAIVGINKHLRIASLFVLVVVKTERGGVVLDGIYAIGPGSGRLHRLPVVKPIARFDEPQR